MIHKRLRSQIGRNLAQCCANARPRITQAALAEELGCSRPHISQIEHGVASLRAEDVIILHAVFALDLCELFHDCCDSLPGPDPNKP